MSSHIFLMPFVKPSVKFAPLSFIMSIVAIRGSNIFDSLSNPAIMKSNKGLKKAFISSHIPLTPFVRPSAKFAPLSAIISIISPVALKIFDSASSGYKISDKDLPKPTPKSIPASFIPFSSSFAFCPLEKRLKNETKASLALLKAPNILPKTPLKAVIVGSSPAFKPVKNPLKKAFSSSQYLYTKSPATAIAVKIAPIGLVANAKLTAFNAEPKAIIPTLALNKTVGSFKSKPLK